MCGCRGKGIKNMRGNGNPILSPRGTSSGGPGPTFSPRKANQQVNSQSVPNEGLTTDQRAQERKRRETILRKLGRL
jgi:hypothetical protein